MTVSRQYRGRLRKGRVVKPHEPGAPYSGKFVLRISPKLHEKLAKLAERERRSLNAQIEVLLDAALKAAGGN